MFQFSVFATGASIGQQILKLKYANMRRRDSNSPWMSRKQKLLHGFILIVLPWLKERFNITIDGLGFSGSSTQIKVGNGYAFLFLIILQIIWHNILNFCLNF